MKLNFLPLLQRMKISQLWLCSVSLSVLLSETIVVSIALLLKGEVPSDYLLIGLVTSCFVSALIVTGLSYFHQKLSDSERQLQSIIEAMPECVKLLSADGKFLQINRAGLKLMEAEALEQIIGQPAQQQVLPKYQTAFKSLTNRVFSGEPAHLEFEMQGLKGTQLWLDTHAVPLRDSNGDISALLAITRDITERKHAEETLKNYAHALAERVKELNCLYSLSELARKPDINEVQFIRQSLDSLAQAYQYPEITAWRIYWGEHCYSSDNFKPSPWLQQAPLKVYGKPAGLIEICYLEARSPEFEGVFLAEERKLLDSVADMLAEFFQRKHTEQRLEQSEAYFRNVFENIPIGVATVSLDQQRFLSANLTYCAIFGYPRAELLTLSTAQLLPEATQTQCMQPLQKLLAGEIEQFTVEAQCLHKTGSLVWTKVSGKIIYRADGTPDCLLLITEDIEQRKRIEETHSFLSQNVRQYTDQSFFESLAQYLCRCLNMNFVCIDRLEGDGLNAQTVAVYHNGAFQDNIVYALKDTPCGEVVGQPLCCFPADVCQFFPNDAVLKTLHAQSYIGVTLWSSTGQPIGLIAVVGEQPLPDKSLAEAVLKIVAARAAGELEHQQAEDVLRLSEARYRSIVEDQNELICRYLPNGRLTFVNGAYARYYQKSPAELVNLNYIPQIPEPDLTTILKKLAEISPTNPTVSYSHRIIAPNGEIRWQQWTQRGIYSADAEIIEYQAVGADITSRKQAEDEKVQLWEVLNKSLNEIYIFDAQTLLFQNVNEGAKQNLGYSDAELYSFRPWDIKPKFSEDSFRELIAPLLSKQKEKIVFETVHRRADGSFYPVEAHVQLVERGDISQFLAIINDITERKQAEQVLREREQQLQLVLEGGHLGFWDWNIITNEVQRNAIWAEMLGYTRQDIENTTQQWSDFIYPEDRERAWQSIHNVLEGRSLYHEAEYRMLHKNGSIHWILDRAAIVQRDDNGKPIRMTGTHTDITRLKQMESALRVSEERFRSIFTQAPVGIALIDSLTGRIYNANQKYADIVGLSVAELQRLNWMQMTYSDDSQVELDKMALINSGKSNSFTLEKRHVRPDGALVWLNVTVARMQVHGKRNPCHHCIIEDITERKQAETELRIAATVFESQEGMVITDADGVILKVNQTFTAITGYSLNEVIGQTPRLLKSMRHDEAFYVDLWQKLCNSGVWQGEIWNKRKNEQIYPEWLTITAVKNSGGAITHYVGTFTDITERKLAEEAMQAAELKATLANQAKSEFLANMSHEIRTPMNAILGFSSILSDLITDPMQRYYLDAIKTSGKTLLHLINDVLDLSKIEAGKLELDYQPAAIKSVFDEIALIFMQKLTEKCIPLSLDVAETVPDCLILDEIRLRQILLNLVGNAVKFTDQGFIQVSVAGRPGTDAQHLDLMISVADTGMGIAKDQQKTIFSAFTQQKHQSRRYGGTGLGLTISKRLIKMMGGTISVKSTLGHGSCFSIKIPNLEICQPSPQCGKDKNSPAQYLHFQPASLLLVDDIEFNRKLLKTYLSEYPELEIIEAESGEQALALIQQQVFDLIFMDKRLPGENGDSVCEKIKSWPGYANTPIIMITASTLSAPAEQQPAFYDLQLNKPVNKSELLAAMQSFLRTDETAEIMPPLPNSASVETVPEQPQATEQLPELVALLESSYQATISRQLDNTGILQIDALIEIAEQLLQIGAQYHCRLLLDWATALKNQAELFDLAGLPKTLHGFAPLIQQLQEQANLDL